MQEIEPFLFNNVPWGIHSLNGEGVFVNINETELRWLGYNRQEVVNKLNFGDVLTEDSRQIFLDNFPRFKKEGKISGVELILISRDGKETAVLINSFAEYDKEGNFLRSISFLTDISELKKAEAKSLAAQSKLTKTITDNATTALFMMDKNGYCTFMNPAAEKMTGYKFEEIGQKPLHYMIHHSHPDGSEYPMRDCPIDRALPENFDVRAHEDVFIRKDGTFFPVVCAAAPIFENGTPVSTIIEVKDITEEKEAERKLEESKERLVKINYELDKFASIVSHDLKAPLRAIGTLADFIIEDADYLKPADKENLLTIKQRVLRMENLIEGILRYSRIGKENIPDEEVNLGVIIPEVIKSLAPNKKIELTVDGTLPVLTYKKIYLVQLFQNLLDNAIKYNDKDVPTVIIRYQELERQHVFCIEDNGPGIEPRFHERIFEIFQTLSARDSYESTGVGLTIVKKIVEDLGGNIAVSSQPGEGTCFKITIPVRT